MLTFSALHPQVYIDSILSMFCDHCILVSCYLEAL